MLERKDILILYERFSTTSVQVDRSHSANYSFFLTSVSLDILVKMYIIIMSLIYNAAVPKMLPCFVKITISKG